MWPLLWLLAWGICFSCWQKSCDIVQVCARVSAYACTRMCLCGMREGERERESEYGGSLLVSHDICWWRCSLGNTWLVSGWWRKCVLHNLNQITDSHAVKAVGGRGEGGRWLSVSEPIYFNKCQGMAARPRKSLWYSVQIRNTQKLSCSFWG